MKVVKDHLIEIQEYSISQISTIIKNTLEQNIGFIKVKGEVSGLKIATSGHIYFSLKDSQSVLACILWKYTASKLKLKLEEGMEVSVIGKITTYPGQSKYQLIVEDVNLAGIGALMQLLETRKEKLAAEGLFSRDKKPLPYLPLKIGIITSLSGAVIRDIMHRIEERCPIIHVIIWPVLVQGESSASQVTEAIEGFNNCSSIPKVDLIIVARGGGSIEDLWSFNEENVVRAVAGSNIPVISAIGHETDYTLIDLASDKRAPTPTAAAEMAVPILKEIRAFLKEIDRKFKSSLFKLLDLYRHKIMILTKSLPNLNDRIFILYQKLDEMEFKIKHFNKIYLARKSHSLERLVINPASYRNLIKLKAQKFEFLHQELFKIISRLITTLSAKLNNQEAMLASLDYRQVLKRGYAIIRHDEKIIKHTNIIKENNNLSITLQDGTIDIEYKVK